MKKTKWLGMMGAMMLPMISAYAEPSIPQPPVSGPPQEAIPADLTPGAHEVFRLSESGTTEEVVLGYVNRSTTTFNLSADDILYFKDIGFSSAVITAMLNRDHELQSRAPAYTYDQKLYAPASPVAVAPQPEQPVAPTPTPAAESAPTPTSEVAPPAPAAETAGTPAPVYVSSPPADVSYFYNDLSPYGTWVQLNGVGWCWQPRVVAINHGWSPYCDGGYWVYSDAGWYWQSTYSWGWAPFHYGRWHLHAGCGWVWVPDRVWGPAWVVWRSEGDRCGWAPLPPHAEFVAGFGWRFNGVAVAANFDFGLHPEHYTFVALRDFNHHDIGHCRLAPTEVTRIYNHTTIINNYVVNNNTIVNQGIKVDRVAAATHTQIHKVPIREAPAGTTTLARTQGTSVIYRHQLKAPSARPATMVAQKVDDRHPIIQHTPITAMRVQRTTSPATKPTTMGTPAHQTPVPDTRNFSRPVPNTPQENALRKPYSTAEDSSAIHAPTQSGSHKTQNQVPQSRSPEAPVSQSVRPASDESNPHQYYPKGNHQSSEVHSLPLNNGRPNSTSPQSDRVNSQSHKDSNPGQGKDGQ